MTDEQINQRIAEACGWVQSKSPEWYQWWHKKGSRNYQIYCPNYVGCLNAMHEVEIGLDDMLFRTYSGILKAYVIGWAAHENEHIVIKATARQRAEAFLRTIGKWEEA